MTEASDTVAGANDDEAERVARLIVSEWVDNLMENSEAEVHAAIKELALRGATMVEFNFDGDEARMALAVVFREAADDIEARTGELIRNGRRIRKEMVR